jgi:Na+:H+ antiporter, NhaA family
VGGEPGSLVGTGEPSRGDDVTDRRPFSRQAWLASERAIPRLLARPIRVFLSTEAAGGIVLLAALLIALTWANSPYGNGYESLWQTRVRIGVGNYQIAEDLRHWINDGLMTVFFFVVGLEIKRELVDGDLRAPRTAAMPVLAALGGMLVPAVLYLALNPTAPGSDGWGIPVATDIAFALGVLTLLGPRVPRGLRLFLLTLAIVDDVGAILVIAVFYSEGVAGSWLGGAAATLLVFFVFQRLGFQNPFLYVPLAFVLWICTQQSGVHATITGVVLGLLAPVARYRERPVIDQVEHHLHPWTSFLIVPLFALANAGVAFGTDSIGDTVSSRVGLGIMVGLVAGKPIGIALAVGLARLLRLGRLPAGVHVRQLVGAAMLAGIGFTVSLFIADLSFGGTGRLAAAKVGILLASLVSAAAGALVLMRRPTVER